jgi:acyl-CoA thioesterase I
VNAPTLRKFLDEGRPTDPRQVVVCAGDSITHGVWSADWVRLLQRDLGPRGYLFVNAGWSGYLSCSLLRELDAVVESGPDVVVVMIGTNDVMASMNDTWRRSYDRQEPPEQPTLQTFRTWLDQILQRLRSGTSARLALLDLPPIGEDLDGAFNVRVGLFNEVIREVAMRHDAAVLPLNARLAALVEVSSTAEPFDGTMKEIRAAMIQRKLLRRRWDKISARAGRVVLTDNVHLNDRAAGEVAALVRSFVDDSSP